MPRRARFAPGGVIYHVLNRANGLDVLFDTPASYRDFLQLVAECADIDGIRILAYCIMPNHWHMLVWPHEDGDLFRFVHRLSVRHAIRRHARNGTAGRGHVYQARYKSFPVQDDRHLLVVLRYIETNPVRARLVATARSWEWSSAAARVPGGARPIVQIEPSPVDLPEDWDASNDGAPDGFELDRLRDSVTRNIPFGDRDWTASTAERIGLRLESRPNGRPRKAEGAPRSPYRARRRAG